ncbi:M1 family metallopeptidase [Streptomyces sp. HSW2009]|uniref:M1 family metallopeptidase n=1 Tax=Streptomyces sp. HSW2009 TaxID=3142890 RepID=UPI0032EE53AF
MTRIMARWSPTSLHRAAVGLAAGLLGASAPRVDATAAPVPEARPGPAAATPDGARYDVRLTADADGSHWTGRQRVSLRNSAARPLREVYLRLWGNGQDGCGTPSAPAPVQVTAVHGGTAQQPTVGCTALAITLPKPLAHGERTALSFDVSIAVPERNDRFGREGTFRFLGNALPVLAVHDAKGWHLDPYVRTGESFYALTSDYRVRLDHPSGLKVPATGRTQTRPGAAGRTVTTSLAPRVREFAWAAGPFETATEVTPGGVRVRSYWTPDAHPDGVRYARRDGAAAVDRFSKEFGRYPYGEIDLVMARQFGGGMEYPGLVLLGVDAEGSAAIHEVAHQWWYGIVGNDQYAAPWLDESFAQYANFRFLNLDMATYCEEEVYWPSEEAALTNSMAYWSAHTNQYTSVIYTNGSCALFRLADVIGQDAMARLLKEYVRDHWHGVSTTADFKRAAQAATDQDLTAFWKEYRVR